MMHILNITAIITLIICFAYALMISAFIYGWLRTQPEYKRSSGNVSVSVIVAARNEETVIKNCLASLAKQTYHGKKEFIIADDNSTDETLQIIRMFCKQHEAFRMISAAGEGKKSAISAGIAVSSNEIIVTTDADCVMEPEWLECIVAYYEHSGAEMIVGPVAFQEESSLFEKMQSLELGALMLATSGAIFLNKPVMCNGANLAYSRKAFMQVNGFEGVDHLASGDDVLLMYKIEKKFPGGIKFLKDKKAIIRTLAKRSVKEFFEQRKRWASKGLRMLNPQTRMVAVITYLCSFSLSLMLLMTVMAACLSRLYLDFLQISLILIGIKCIIDFLLLFLAASFFSKKRFLYLFLPEQIIYIFYVVVTGFFGNKGRYEWKGRKI